MKTVQSLTPEDEHLKSWLEIRVENGLAVNTLEKAAKLPDRIVKRFLSGERKKLDDHRRPLVDHLMKYFGYTE